MERHFTPGGSAKGLSRRLRVTSNSTKAGSGPTAKPEPQQPLGARVPAEPGHHDLPPSRPGQARLGTLTRGQKRCPQLQPRFPLSRARPAPRGRRFRARTFHTPPDPSLRPPRLSAENAPSREDAGRLRTLKDFFSGPRRSSKLPNLGPFPPGRRFVTAARAEVARPRARPGRRQGPPRAGGRGLGLRAGPGDNGAPRPEAPEPLWPRGPRSLPGSVPAKRLVSPGLFLSSFWLRERVIRRGGLGSRGFRPRRASCPHRRASASAKSDARVSVFPGSSAGRLPRVSEPRPRGVHPSPGLCALQPGLGSFASLSGTTVPHLQLKSPPPPKPSPDLPQLFDNFIVVSLPLVVSDSVCHLQCVMKAKVQSSALVAFLSPVPIKASTRC
nr:uncharacterized protein LOC111775551 [Equus caballus]